MPQIKIERIVSFTSEDSTHTASNILSKDTSKKWKCKAPGEKSASVVLQLDQPYVINAIDIGNENSAYVEVLVSRSSAPEDFKVLLVMSSFMTPLEARQTLNVNKVRMFKRDDLSDPERDEKWDRLKIVCTQPFNRHTQYGLSFINLYSSEGKDDGTPRPNRIGQFIVRPESPDSISAGSLFARKKQTQDNAGEQTLKGAAAIREATSLAHVGSPLPKQKIKLNLAATPNSQVNKKRNLDEDEGSSSASKERKERNRNELLYSKDEEDKHDKIDKLVEKKAEEKNRKHDKEDKQTNKPKDAPKDQQNKHRQTAGKTATTPGDSKTKKRNDNKPREPKESVKRKQGTDSGHNTKKPKKTTIGKPFARLLEDVVLVISGIQNPDRASLRSMALSMGARYKADWDNTCTHLICAFANTPKFNQVKGKGKIVKRQWLEDGYNQRKKLPWRRYALDKADRGPESDEEVCEQDNTPSPEPVETSIINSDGSDDDTKEPGSDTDDRIAEIRRKQDVATTDIFDVDTDSESTDFGSNETNPELKHKLKNFFEDKLFYVDQNFDKDVQKKLKQYIAAYNGLIVDNLELSIDIMVTDAANYKVLRDFYPSAIFVAPDWIWECHNCQELVPMKGYIYE